MKILYVSTLSITINTFLVPHVKMLIEKNHSVDIACSINQPISKELELLGCKILDIPFSRKPGDINNLKAFIKIRNIIAENNYEIIHTHTPNASFITRLAAFRSSSIIIYTAHGFHFYKGSKLRNWIFFYPLEKIASRFTDIIITINEEDYQLANSKFYSKIVVKNHGVGVDPTIVRKISDEQISLIKEENKIKNNDVVFTCIGELNKNKNQMNVLKAFREISHEYSNFKLIIIGSGPESERLKKYVTDNELEQKVYFTGYIDNVFNFLKITNFLVSFSKREGLPINVIEGMFFGIPIIASNIRGNKDLMQSKCNGILLKKNTVDELVVSLRDVLSNKISFSFGKDYFNDIQKYSTNKVLNELTDVYNLAVKMRL